MICVLRVVCCVLFCVACVLSFVVRFILLLLFRLSRVVVCDGLLCVLCVPWAALFTMYCTEFRVVFSRAPSCVLCCG